MVLVLVLVLHDQHEGLTLGRTAPTTAQDAMKRPRRVCRSGSAPSRLLAAVAVGSVLALATFAWVSTSRRVRAPTAPQHLYPGKPRGDTPSRPAYDNGVPSERALLIDATWTARPRAETEAEASAAAERIHAEYPLVDEPRSTVFRSRVDLSAFAGKPEELRDFIAYNVVAQWWAANPPAERARDDGRRVFTVAFCVFDQNADRFYPEPQNEWFAWWLTENAAFADLAVRYAPCVPTEAQLPREVEPASEAGMRMLGLLDVDVRFCQFGSASVVRLLSRVGPADAVSPVATAPRLARAGLAPDREGFTHRGRLQWPEVVQQLVDPGSGRPVKPMLVRECIEPWRQESVGVGLQLEAKREPREMARAAVSLFQPHLVNSVGRRLGPRPGQYVLSSWTFKAHGRGPYPRSVAELVVRPTGFDARAAREAKSLFAVFLNSHCASPLASTVGVLIRDLFAVRLATTYKPVHALGQCPLVQTERLGVPFGERAREVRESNELGGFKTYAKFKFTIAFENSRSPSYMSEKLLLAWSARSVPVYFGPGRVAVAESFNDRSMLYCDFPEPWSDERALKRFRDRLCREEVGPDWDRDATGRCFAVVAEEIKRRLEPALDACVAQVRALDEDDAAYERMLAEPLVPKRRLVGVWNRTRSGELIRAAYEAMGFAEGVSPAWASEESAQATAGDSPV